MSIPKDNTEWETQFSSIKSSLSRFSAEQHASVPTQANRTIDHTQLGLTATEEQINELCAQASKYQFATVCVRLKHVQQAAQQLRQSPDVGVACVVGFHEGMYETSEKEVEARKAVRFGATELDMVLKYPLLKEKQYNEVYEDILAVRKAAPLPVRLKVILETSQLSRDEIIAGSVISCLAGADYIKTSTGFNGAGATVENVALMYEIAKLVGKGTKVKASGGVRTAADCIKMLKAGAERIGASSGVKIVQELEGAKIVDRGSSEGY
ncbi:2-deoxyribose-5-phosphate aldolase [Aspergillus lucknowensis]|uniref:deoxyribose-phosphate aldolase n=1 Tax=Aspergillus lucknowensis TaxID=176173 RepID=A0ABR4LYJ1_9EURO